MFVAIKRPLQYAREDREALWVPVAEAPGALQDAMGSKPMRRVLKLQRVHESSGQYFW